MMVIFFLEMAKEFEDGGLGFFSYYKLYKLPCHFVCGVWVAWNILSCTWLFIKESIIELCQ